MADCFSCQTAFHEVGKKSKPRYKLGNYTSPKTFRLLYPVSDKSDASSLFVCGACLSGVKKRTVPKKKYRLKRKFPLPPNVEPVEKKKSKKDDDIDASIEDIRMHNFKRAFSNLAKTCKGARSALLDVCCQIIKTEMTALKKKCSQFSAECSMESIEQFQWQTAIQEFQDTGPFTVKALQSMLPQAKAIQRYRMVGQRHRKRQQTTQEANLLLQTRLGVLLGTKLYTCRPRKFKFLQSCVGVQLWTQEATHHLFTTLNRMGVSQCVDSARGHIDKLRGKHDLEILGWKKELEETTVEPIEKQKTEPKIRLFKEYSQSSPVTYSVGWDNVQLEQHAKHQCTEHQSKFLIWGMCFGVQHRVTFAHKDETVCKAIDLPVSTFLPTQQEMDDVKVHMGVIVQRILTVHFSKLEHINVTQHTVHQYSAEMRSKSNVVNLGVVDANPSSTAGVTDILDFLHKYVPDRGDGDVLPVLCAGDGLSIERMAGAHHSRSNEETARERLEGLVSSPQEFHKEMLLLQDTIDALYYGRSDGSRGTMAQLRTAFKHKSFKKEVKANFQHAWDLMEFCTEAYVSMCAMTLLGMCQKDEVPPSFPGSASKLEQEKWLKEISRQIVEFAWLQPTMEDSRTVEEAYIATQVEQRRNHMANIFPFCSCMQDTGEMMVQCSSWRCKRMWSNISCAGITVIPDADDDWFCSDECRQDGTYIYCSCHERRGGKMVQCGRTDKCTQQEWYHVDCLMLDANGLPDVWYCCRECELKSESTDHQVLNYSKLIIWHGLNHLIRRDAVREGNGQAILIHWKLDMWSYWLQGHFKYFIIGHYLLSATSGFLPKRLSDDLTWNRVCNMHGREGGNIGLDLVNEFINNEFKDVEDLPRKVYRRTSFQVCRNGWALRKGVYVRMSEKQLIDQRYQTDVSTFCSDYFPDGLCCFFPGRQHDGMPDIPWQLVIRNREKMGSKLKELCGKLDIWKRVAEL